MNNETITLSRERFRALLAVCVTAEGLLDALNNKSTLVPYYTDRLSQKVDHSEAVRQAEWNKIREESAASRERAARLMAERDIGVG